MNVIIISPNSSKKALANYAATIFADMPLSEITNDKIALEIRYWREKYPPEDKPTLIKYLADRFFAEMVDWIENNQKVFGLMEK